MAHFGSFDVCLIPSRLAHKYLQKFLLPSGTALGHQPVRVLGETLNKHPCGSWLQIGREGGNWDKLSKLSAKGPEHQGSVEGGLEEGQLRAFRRRFGGIIFCGFYFRFLWIKKPTLWGNDESGSWSLLDAADHLFLLLPSGNLSSPLLPSGIKSHRESCL